MSINTGGGGAYTKTTLVAGMCESESAGLDTKGNTKGNLALDNIHKALVWYQQFTTLQK